MNSGKSYDQHLQHTLEDGYRETFLLAAEDLNGKSKLLQKIEGRAPLTLTTTFWDYDRGPFSKTVVEEANRQVWDWMGFSIMRIRAHERSTDD